MTNAKYWMLTKGGGIFEWPVFVPIVIVIDSFSKVSPEVADQFQKNLMSLTHWVLTLRERAQAVTLSYSLSLKVRDKIWRNAILKERKIRVFEDLTQSTKDARNELCPLVVQARKEGKKAGFRGPFAYIDRKSISTND